MSRIDNSLIVISLLPWLSAMWVNWYAIEMGFVHSNESRDVVRLALHVVAGFIAAYLAILFIWYRKQRFRLYNCLPYLSCISFLIWLKSLGWPQWT